MRLLFMPALVVIACLLLGRAGTALAHPVGDISVNRYSRIELSAASIRLRYVVDAAEIPTVAESAKLDSNHDGEVAEAERATYLERKARQLLRNLALAVDGAPVSARIVSADLAFLPGQAGLQTLRVAFTFEAPSPAPAGRPATLSYRDDNFGAAIGWTEIVVLAGDGVRVLQSTAPDTDRTDELRSYPPDLLANPPDQREARATFAVSVAAGAASPGAQHGAPTGLDGPTGPSRSVPGAAPLEAFVERLIEPAAAILTLLGLAMALEALVAMGLLA